MVKIAGSLAVFKKGVREINSVIKKDADFRHPLMSYKLLLIFNKLF